MDIDRAYLKKQVAIVGAGPAGLMAAEVLVQSGLKPVLYDAMPTPARKFLMAGKSGLNLSHNEPLDHFLTRYGAGQERLATAVRAFGAGAIQAWALDLGVETFVGSSGRIFPTSFKASPLLRAWLKRLQDKGATLIPRHRFRDWADDDALIFDTPNGEKSVKADAVLMALGGPSWPKLGSDAAWVPAFRRRGIEIRSFRPANCGFDVAWSDYFRDRFEGEPVKNVRLSFAGQSTQGDFVVSQTGVEGSAVYTLSATLRDDIERRGQAILHIDLCPDRSQSALIAALEKPRGKKSLSTHLKRATGLQGVKAGLLRECLDTNIFDDPTKLAAAIKALPLKLDDPRPIGEAISSAGGVAFEALDKHLMVKSRPGLFCAGEMIDWEAPTGGYLLTACFAQGRQAAHGILEWFNQQVD